MNGSLQGRVKAVLIVEDSGVQRAHLASLLQLLGVGRVHQAANGAEALALLETLTELPDAMVIDLHMPVMDGVELIQHLQARDLRIPFVVASTRESTLVSAVLEMARAHGQQVSRAAHKPLTLEVLSEALADCLQAPADRHDGQLVCVQPSQLALAIERGAIQPYFQPKVDVRSGLIRGVEALARWSDDAAGPVTPDRFIPVAEAEGLIHALTLSVLQQAVTRVAGWQARGLTLSVAVNLSPKLLDSSRLVGEIDAIVQGARIRPEQLVLEVTENALISCEGLALGTLARLRMAGYGLSIDDYGTGFSSMQQLARVPFTELKIDRSFVHGAHANEHLRVMLQSSIEMASRLGLTSVAEGVESLDDWAWLHRYGCDVGQGWLIGRAMPGDELPAWLRSHQARLAELRSAPFTRPAAASGPHSI
ncbi:EAL domain-containing response regulator [Roseateles sp.]|uniref:EAL domain-containing response regulator n=1 Tax=Roseateles sp. TaxID=1971397 RepID=UPI0025EAAC4D|nr:EAL domain-containing response regulator [Roseateles sp.]MBV8035886.1 EAL domain-containing response regulator [Roseateles sp.]